ncbi:ATP-binding protein [Fulvivirga sp. 29W222]|uniref:ATP-binding protein n=1 Tax=Fulvivirga marina TaxID=2494733 RepID=A0A937G398_9BACT|nr:ATP-binding protein [Fulvivirga marina]MBL6449892.1 ATP-binding protein [Fulvivirga marina]
MEKGYEDTDKSIKKVVVIGPECTGKSTLSSKLAEHYNTCWVEEYARQYIDELDRPYEAEDLLKIAQGQLANEDKLTAKARKLLICDTNLIVIKIWSEFKYGFCHQEILDGINSRKYGLYLLTSIDLPWEDDPQRENPELRDYFHNLFKSTLRELNLPYVEIKGELSERKLTAIKAINEFLTPQSGF